MKLPIKILILIFAVGLLSTNFFIKSKKEKKFKVLIDAGHGGKDPGAVGDAKKKIYEKDIALRVALRLGYLIKKKIKNIEVLYTRKKDVFIKLKDRANLANKNKVDLFISIHCNSNRKKQINGTETYVMGTHVNKESLEVAKRENQVIFMEDNYEINYKGFDNSEESLIGLGYTKNMFLEQSINFAKLVEEEFKKNKNLNSNGIKQAGFLVIREVAMPSVLIEIGFISNKKERVFLNSKNGINKISTSIFKALKKYIDIFNVHKKEFENIRDEANAKKKSSDENNVVSKLLPKKNETLYKVQIKISKKKLNLKSFGLKNTDDLDFYFDNGYYKYTYGREKTMSGIIKKLNYIKNKGFKDAFIVKFRNNKRI